MTSYTVVAGAATPKAVKFRAPHAALDMKVMALAKETNMDFVPGCEERGVCRHLLIYEMDVVTGVAFSIAHREMCAVNNLKLGSCSVCPAPLLPPRYHPALTAQILCVELDSSRCHGSVVRHGHYDLRSLSAAQISHQGSA